MQTARTRYKIQDRKKTSRLTTRRSVDVKVSDSEDEQPQAFMALRSSSSRIPTFQSMAREATTQSHADGWTDVDVPSRNPKFSTGFFRGKSFLDVVNEFPEHYFQAARTKGQLPRENAEFKEWVEHHFTIDGKNLRRKAVVAPAQSSTLDPSFCPHVNVHHKRSSARYKRHTCKDCGHTWNEERGVPQNDPEMCPHLNTDHRGSNAYVRKTFCKDCGTYIDVVPQKAYKQQKEWKDSLPEPTAEEQAMLMRVMDHRRISKQELDLAINLVTAKVHALQDTTEGFSLLEVCDGFLDSADEACESSRGRRTAFVNARRTRTETQNMKLRVVDPLNDAGVWVIVDDACNSCCHGSEWRKNAEAKWRWKGLKCHLNDARQHKFDGIGKGNAQSGGKHWMPCAVQLVESGLNIPGSVDSHEIPDKDHPLLLSQAVQAKFGFVKNMRKRNHCL